MGPARQQGRGRDVVGLTYSPSVAAMARTWAVSRSSMIKARVENTTSFPVLSRRSTTAAR